MLHVKRALLSVSDKTDIIEIASFLQKKDVQILSTGGTLKVLQKNNIPTQSIEDYTGFPEILGGRVKTLHPKIHGGLLARRNLLEDEKALKKHGIQYIDLLIVNLYPFGETIANKNVTIETAIENIDIGGPAMIRGAAKNYSHTLVICEPKDYAHIIKEWKEEGGISTKTRLKMSCKAFNHTASYDSMIANYLNNITKQNFPEKLTLGYHKMQALRYGENPHQKAAYYISNHKFFSQKEDEDWVQIQGKELSYNNILDANAALRTVLSLPALGVCIIKHLNPCGAAIIKSKNFSTSPFELQKEDPLLREELHSAFLRARSCDPVSAFGGIIAIQGIVNGKLAHTICENFAEVILSYGYTKEAIEIFSSKKNLRLLKYNPSFFERSNKKENNLSNNLANMEVRNAMGGLLYQEKDLPTMKENFKNWDIVTQKKADTKLLEGMVFAWYLAKNIRSNAIVFCSPYETLGIGVGQMSRINSVEIAVSKAHQANKNLQNSIVASDAFFPFRDGIDALAEAGARAVVQPGGSVKDKEVIAAANEHNIVMALTGIRHFLH